MFFQQTPQPFIVEIIRPPTQELTVTDLLVNSLGLAGLLALAAIPFGVVVGYLLIRWNRRRPPEADHMPHIAPSLEITEPRDPPSGPTP